MTAFVPSPLIQSTPALADDFADTGRPYPNDLDLTKWGRYALTSDGTTRDPTLTTVSGGMLHITSKGVSGTGIFMLTQPNHPTGVTQQPYGLWEVTLRVNQDPDHSGVAFLWPNSENWPTDKELDFAEAFGATAQKVVFTTHYLKQDATGAYLPNIAGNRGAHQYPAVAMDFTQFHKFSVQILPAPNLSVTYAIDDVVIFVETDPLLVPTSVQNLRIQAGANAGTTTASTTTYSMDVDRVRYYTLIPVGAPEDPLTLDLNDPTPGASNDQWGVTLNGNFDAIEQNAALVAQALANAALKSDLAAALARISALEASLAPGSAPLAPTIGTATALTNGVSVAFTAASSGTAATSFRVQLSTGQTQTGTASPITIGGLPSGTPVTATVYGVNVKGTSPASAASNSVTPTAASVAPNAPTIGTAVAGTNSATVAFTPPSSGTPPTSYTVTASTGQTQTGTTTPIVIGGLTAGVGVSFVVTALNAGGTSPNSASSGTVTPTAPAVTSSSNRGRLVFGSAPKVMVTGETGVPQGSNTLTAYWTPTTADTAARATPQTMTGTGTAQQAQTAYQVQILAAGTTTPVLYDTGTVTGSAGSAVIPYAGTPGTRYYAQVRVQQTDGQWSAYEGTRFVWPSGATLYVEDFGALLDGVTNDGADYNNILGAGKVYFGPLRNAFKAANPGDLVTYRTANKSTVVVGAACSGTQLSYGTAVFTPAMVGQKVMVLGVGPWDASGFATLRTTISSVSADGKSAVMAAAATNPSTSARVHVGYRESLVGHMDIDTNAGPGGFTFDGGGNLLFSVDPNSAGFNINNRNDVTIRNVVYEHRNVVSRGTGQNQNSGTFFIQGTSSGNRIVNCVSIHARDAAFMNIGVGVIDNHYLNCIDDHSMADAFHVTGSASRIRFGRCTAYYPGDDFMANIGYYSDGLSARPGKVWWYDMTLHGQDWGRGISFGGAIDILATNITLDGTADCAVIAGADSDQSQSERCQIIGLTVTRPNYRIKTKPTYSQGATTSSTVGDQPWLKLLSTHGLTQTDLLFENITVDGGRYQQTIQYANSSAAGDYSFYNDPTIVLRGITLTGLVNAGSSWLDDYTYQYHFDYSGITLPTGSNARLGSANAGSTTAGFH